MNLTALSRSFLIQKNIFVSARRTKIVATRRVFWAPVCQKYCCDQGSTPDRAGEADHKAGVKDAASLRMGRVAEVEGKEEEERTGKRGIRTRGYGIRNRA